MQIEIPNIEAEEYQELHALFRDIIAFGGISSFYDHGTKNAAFEGEFDFIPTALLPFVKQNKLFDECKFVKRMKRESEAKHDV